MNNKKSKVLVTGGAGFVGSNVVDALISRGEDVVVLDIKSYAEATNIHHQKDNITYVEGDIRDTELLLRLCKNCTHVLHLAAIVSVPFSLKDPVGTHDTNVNGMLSVLEASRQSGVKRVVYASSAAVYGDTNSVPTAEDVVLAPMSPYGLHKLINEQYAQMYGNVYGLETVGLRYFNIFGKRQNSNSSYSGVISIFANNIKNGMQSIIYGDGSATRDFIHVDNVVNVSIDAFYAKDIAGEVFNVGSGEETSIYELFSIMNSLSGKKLSVEYKDMKEGDIQRSCASIEKISKKIGYRVTRNIKDGLADTLGIV